MLTLDKSEPRVDLFDTVPQEVTDLLQCETEILERDEAV
jgi:hypothetical protein